MSNLNPYAAPVDPSMPPPMNSGMNLASQNQRFLTAILDNLILYGLNYGIGFALGFLMFNVFGFSLTVDNQPAWNLVFTLIGLGILIVYFTLLEATTGRTVGKIIMGTKVVNANGGTPSFGQILGRSFCRFIPFEALSFLGNKGFPIGWHDRIPGTRVVKTR
jgi:uncharacterized RDD family membrane protein YckC